MPEAPPASGVSIVVTSRPDRAAFWLGVALAAVVFVYLELHADAA